MPARPSQDEIDAFVTAAREGKIAKLTDFIDRFGVEHINDCNADGHPALSTAAGDKHERAALTLIDRGADILFDGLRGTYSPLIMAASRGLPNVVRALLELGADVNEQLPGGRYTPLHYAVNNGFPDVARMLLAYGADITLKTDWGWDVRTVGWSVEEDSPSLKAMREWKESDRNAWHEAHGPFNPGEWSGIRQRIAERQFAVEAQFLSEGTKQAMKPLPKITFAPKAR